MSSKALIGNLAFRIPRLRTIGVEILRDPSLNKGSAYSLRERQILGLHGLLPPSIFHQTEQVSNVLTNVYRLTDDLDRYNLLMSLQDRNEKLFHKTISCNMEYILPLISIPTVGRACKSYSLIMRRPRGVFITMNDKGHVRSILHNWPERRVRAVAMTNGERVLGFGDMGIHGMTISVEKSVLYTALGGVFPEYCLPMTIDVGTDNKQLRENEFYVGLRQERVPCYEFEELLDEIMCALKDAYGSHVCVQLEDFGSQNALKFLEKYRNNHSVFADDIQGVAAVVLSVLLSSHKITGMNLEDHKFLFFGAGGAAIGIARLIVAALKQDGMNEADAKSRIVMMDSNGLLVKNRPDGVTESTKTEFMRDDISFCNKLSVAINNIKPTVLIGASAEADSFTREVLTTMASLNKHPIIFALSNPTEKSECTAEAAYRSTEGRCIFISGAPFPPTKTPYGDELCPGQGNTFYTFPGIMQAVTAAQIQPITEDLFLTAAKTIAGMTTEADIRARRMLPPVSKLRLVAHNVAVEVVKKAYADGIAAYQPEPSDKELFICMNTYDSDYVDFTPDQYEWHDCGKK